MKKNKIKMSVQCSVLEQPLSGGSAATRCTRLTSHLALGVRPPGDCHACHTAPICSHHLLQRSEFGFSVRPSSIAGGGLGLFVDKYVPKGADLGEYTGITRPSGDAPPGRYSLYLYGDRVVCADDPLRSSVLRYANHQPLRRANAYIVAHDRGTMHMGCRMIRASRAIHGTAERPAEVFINYGRSYVF